MGKIDDAVALAVKIANDDSHGYSQRNRDGNPDFDCSSLIIYIWQSCGVPVKDRGATYTGNMVQAFLQAGFRKVNPAIESLQAGDVLINVVHHTAIYIGNGKIVQATIAENGTIHGTPGDQTGTEIGIFPYYDFPWDYVLRYDGDPGQQEIISVNISYGENSCRDTKMPMVRKGDYGPAISAIQGALKYHGFFSQSDINGCFDGKTERAVISFQTKHKIEIDGIVGPETWNELSFWR